MRATNAEACVRTKGVHGGKAPAAFVPGRVLGERELARGSGSTLRFSERLSDDLKIVLVHDIAGPLGLHLTHREAGSGN